MKLKEIAHSRTGDKGDISIISVIALDPENYPLLKEKVSPDFVRSVLKDQVKGSIDRYEVDSICALNFVMSQALGGGVTRSLALDRHGKTLGSLLLEAEL